MPIKKFHEKNIAALVKIETTENTYNAPAATDAVAATELTGSVTYETGNYMYLGDDLSRDEFTYQKDTYADFSLTTPQQVLGTLNPALAVVDAPLSEMFQSCGGYVTVNATSGEVTIDNSQKSTTTVSIDYRKTSSDDAVNQKLYKFTGVRGSVDINANLGEVPTLKFNMKGNALSPIADPIKSPDFGTQTSSVVAAVRQSNIVTAQLARLDGSFTSTGAVTTITKTANVATVTFGSAHSLGAVGDIRAITVSGATDSLYNGVFLATITGTATLTYVMKATPASNASGTFTITKGPAAETFCFSTLAATNFFGFDYARYLTGCEEGFAKSAVPTDLTVTMLEDQVGGTSFDPDANVMNFYGAQIKFGTAAGKYVTYKWDKLQLANVKEGKVASYFGREVQFRNTGKSYIILN